MSAGLSVALFAAAQAASSNGGYGPTSTLVSPTAPPVPAETQRECANSPAPNPGSREIVVCAVKPNGYRIDPDVLAARRMKKNGESVRPRSPHETFADHSCATVGPMGCRGQPTIDVLTAATALATMTERLSKGQEIGSMFETQPTPSEYQLYVQAKQEREEAEAVRAAKARAAAARAAADHAPAH